MQGEFGGNKFIPEDAAAYTVGSATAVQIASRAIGGNANNGIEAKIIHIANNGLVTAYLGRSAVTAAAGFPITAGTVFSWAYGGNLYAITSSGTTDIRVIREGTDEVPSTPITSSLSSSSSGSSASSA